MPLSSKDEIVAVFNIQDYPKIIKNDVNSKNFIYPMSRYEIGRSLAPIIVVRIFAITLKGNFIVQRRSKNKRTFGGLWIDSASGLVQYNKK